MASRLGTSGAGGGGGGFGLGKVLSISWHVLALAVFTYAFQSLHHLSTISGIDIESQFGGHYQFLTNLGLWISRLGMVLALLGDLLPSSALLRTTKLSVCVAALPIETLISILYWTVVNINPELLIPPKKVADPKNPAQFVWETVRIPLPVDLALHAAPAIFLLIDYLFFSPPFPPHIKPMLISASATIAYCAWAEVCASHNGTYPYPLLNVLSTPARLFLYATCSAVFVGVLEIVRIVHKKLDKILGRSWSPTGGKAAGKGQQPGRTTSGGRKSK